MWCDVCQMHDYEICDVLGTGMWCIHDVAAVSCCCTGQPAEMLTCKCHPTARWKHPSSQPKSSTIQGNFTTFKSTLIMLIPGNSTWNFSMLCRNTRSQTYPKYNPYWQRESVEIEDRIKHEWVAVLFSPRRHAPAKPGTRMTLVMNERHLWWMKRAIWGVMYECMLWSMRELSIASYATVSTTVAGSASAKFCTLTWVSPLQNTYLTHFPEKTLRALYMSCYKSISCHDITDQY